VFEQHEGVRSRVGLQLRCQGTHLQKGVEYQVLQAQIAKQTEKFERLTLQGFPKTLNFLEKEFFGIRSL
jgi:hypothetical protein